MANVFIEQHGPKKYVALQNKKVIASAKTHKKAAEKAHDKRPDDAILAERVRDTSRGSRDKWRRIYG